MNPLSSNTTRPTKRSPPLIANAQFGTILFVATELMFFVALISAYLVIQASSIHLWKPPTGAMLPFAVTMVNTFVLLLSGGFLFAAARRHSLKGDGVVKAYLSQALILGSVFVGVQGFEWIRLFAQGMTLTSGIFGACFFLLVGMHGIHALGGCIALLWGLNRLYRGNLSQDALWSLVIFWGFIVGIWPILYGLVYYS